MDSLRQQVERLIIENRNSLNDPTTNEPYDVKGIADDVIELIIEARIDELKWAKEAEIGKFKIDMRYNARLKELKALNHRKDE